MELRFRIIPDGGEPYEVGADSRDIIKWEEGRPGRSLSALQANQRLTDLSAIACYAATRKGYYHGSLEVFAATTALEVIAPEPASADPTQPGR